MKSYAKFKGFMPKLYIDKQNKLENASRKRGLTYLLLLNIILIPINLKHFLNKGEENEVIIINEISDKKEDIGRWLHLNCESLNKIDVKSNYATLELTKFEEIYNIEEEGFKVNKITSNNNLSIIEVVDEK